MRFFRFLQWKKWTRLLTKKKAVVGKQGVKVEEGETYLSKKRPAESATETPHQDKKLKVSPQKSATETPHQDKKLKVSPQVTVYSADYVAKFGQPQKCDVCSREFGTSAALKAHTSLLESHASARV